MSKILTYEDVAGLFQTWPKSFSSRWKRNLNKDELYEILEKKLHEHQQREIEDKFFNLSVDSIITALIYLDEHKIDHVEESKVQNKFKQQQKKKS